MSKRVRSRSLGEASFAIDNASKYPNNPEGNSSSHSVIKMDLGNQSTQDEEHPGFSREQLGVGDLGGDFYSIKRERYVTQGPQAFKSYTWPPLPNFFARYSEGKDLCLATNPNIHGYPSSLESSDDDLAVWGTRAIANCAPAQPMANAGTAIGEFMKDGLPSIPVINSLKKRAGVAVAAGSEFLNLAFGWQPLVRDVKSIAAAASNVDLYVAQLLRDSGQQVRRQYSFRPTISVQDYPVPYGRPYSTLLEGVLEWDGTYGRPVWTERKEIRRWFSGSFTYYLSDQVRADLQNYGSQARAVLGADLTPETLWNLAPWSWMVDWVSNVGDVISNIQRFSDNGMVMQYGYIMEHAIHTIRCDWEGSSTFAGEIVPKSVGSFVLKTETKKRLGASPYGFGFNWDGLSAFQKSVLIALGLSRKR